LRAFVMSGSLTLITAGHNWGADSRRARLEARRAAQRLRGSKEAAVQLPRPMALVF
jgi:hypothetical protein